MILRRLVVRNFAGLNPGALIPAFSPSITVIHGPNGAGKSTLMRALTYALYQRHGVKSDQAIAETLPVGTDVTPSVELELDARGETWRIVKRFINRRASELAVLRGGTFEPVAEGDAADERIRDLLGAAFPGRGVADASLRGIGEILVVDQGRLRFGSELGEGARRTLKDVIHDVATTGATQELIAVVRKRYAEIYTPSGQLVKGKHAAPPVATQGRLDDARRELDAVRRDVADAREIEAEIARVEADAAAMSLEREGMKGEIDGLTAAVVDWARRRERFKQQTQDAARADVDARNQAQACLEIAASRARRAELETKLAAHAAKVDEAERRFATLDRDAAGANQLLNLPNTREAELVLIQNELKDARLAREIAREAADLDRQLVRYDAAAGEAAEIRRDLAATRRPDRNELQKLQAAANSRRELQVQLDLTRLRVRITTERDVQVDQGGDVTQVPAGKHLDLRGDDPLRFAIPGVGAFEVGGPVAERLPQLKTELGQAQRELDLATAAFGTCDANELARLADVRRDAETRLAAAQKAMAQAFRDEAAALAARDRLSRLQQDLAAQGAAHPAWMGAVPGEADVKVLDLREAAARKAHDAEDAARRAQWDAARVAAAAAREELDRARKAQATDRAEATKVEGDLERLVRDGLDDATRRARAADAADLAARLAAAVRAEQQDLDLLGNPDEQLVQRKSALESCEKQVAVARQRRDVLAGRLDGLRRRGLWTRLGELQEQVAAGEARLESETLEAEATRLLHDTIEEEQRLGFERVVEPVRAKLERLVRNVFAQKFAVGIAESLLPEKLLDEYGRSLSLEQLSAGSADQLALLTRLAIGEVHAEHAGRHVLVLDDPLVNTDRERRSRLLAIFTGALPRLQLVIFTCHPEHYVGLPTDRTTSISMVDARQALVAEQAAR